MQQEPTNYMENTDYLGFSCINVAKWITQYLAQCQILSELTLHKTFNVQVILIIHNFRRGKCGL